MAPAEQAARLVLARLPTGVPPRPRAKGLTGAPRPAGRAMRGRRGYPSPTAVAL